MNRKGFTLIELLAVLVILGIVMVIALPAITSSMGRTKDKQNQSRINLILSSAEVYVSDHKNEVYANMVSDGDNEKYCYIRIQEDLVDGRYLTSELIKDMDDKELNGVIKYSSDGEYKYFNHIENGDSEKYCS